MKNHSTKRALLLSALAIVMSVAMLIGSTFAWFTDSASTAVNTIQSGTLKIDIQKADGTSLDGQTINFVNVNDSADILWEPGVTFNTEPFYIVNNGSLNLKFQFDIVGAAGDVELLDVISFTAIGAGVNYLTAGEQLLAPGAKLGPIVITGVMDKNAGNQYQGKTVTGLAISLVATQAAVESDSISNEYDKDAVNMSPVHKLPATSKDMSLSTNGNKPVVIDLPAEVIDDLKGNNVTSISLIASDAREEIVNGKQSVIFDVVELVNQNGQIIDTEALALDEFTVTLPTGYAEGTEVTIFHDGEYIKLGTVGANGVLTYTTTHLCEITLQAGLEKVEDGVFKVTATGNYEIYNANGLYWFAGEVNKYSNYEHPFENITVSLLTDIDLKDAEWIPIGDYRFQANRFCGTFDGMGNTISNFKITKKTSKNDSNKSSYGFFGNVDGTIMNLAIENVTVSSYAYTGALVGRLNGGSVINCHVKNANVKPSYWQGGGMIGQLNDGCTVKDCTISNSTVTGASAIGGMFGPLTATGADKKLLFENCVVSDCTILQEGGFGESYDRLFGAMFADVDVADNETVIKNCKVVNTTVKGEGTTALYNTLSGSEVYIDGVKK